MFDFFFGIFRAFGAIIEGIFKVVESVFTTIGNVLESFFNGIEGLVEAMSDMFVSMVEALGGRPYFNRGAARNTLSGNTLKTEQYIIDGNEDVYKKVKLQSVYGEEKEQALKAIKETNSQMYPLQLRK